MVSIRAHRFPRRIATLVANAQYRHAVRLHGGFAHPESLGRFPEAQRPENLKKQIAFLRKLL